jgi:hypothetical protein
MTFKLPIVLIIALIAALVGAGTTYVVVPKADPEMTELLRRQVELAEQEAEARRAAQDAARRTLSFDEEQFPTQGGREMQIQRPGQ